MAMKRLSCWIGRHKWELRTDHGEEFKVCAVCGKSPRKVAGRPRLVDGADTSYRDGPSYGGDIGGGV